MGSLYKRKVREANGEWKELPTWWLKYYQNGRAVRESSSTKSERVARRMLRVREGDVERGIPVNPKMDRFMFEEAAQDLIHDYEANGKKSIRVLKQRIVKHLAPFFQGVSQEINGVGGDVGKTPGFQFDFPGDYIRAFDERPELFLAFL